MTVVIGGRARKERDQHIQTLAQRYHKELEGMTTPELATMVRNLKADDDRKELPSAPSFAEQIRVAREGAR